MLRLFLTGILSLIIISCSTTFNVAFDTYLSKSPTKALSYSDEKFDFNFIPVSNGIWFTIKNNTEQTAYLIWDKSYFIDPSGNSYKALNYDVIAITDEVARRENNESPIPAKSTFSRFTTSNTNLQKFSEYNSKTVNNYFTNYSYTTSFNKDFFNIGNYWITKFDFNETSGYYYSSGDKTLEPEDIYLNKKCEDIKKFIKQNNNLGLGLFIKDSEKTYEYRFDFKIKEVKIYKEDFNGRNILRRTLSEINNFDLNGVTK